MSAVLPERRDTGSWIRSVLGISLLFAAVGPPIGAVVFIVGGELKSASLGTQSGLTAAFIPVVGYLVLFSYFFGLLPAAVAGLLVAVSKLAFGRVRWWMALSIGVLVGLGFIWDMERRPAWFQAPNAPPDWSLRAVSLLINVVPTMLCWLIIRNWYQANGASEGRT